MLISKHGWYGLTQLLIYRYNVIYIAFVSFYGLVDTAFCAGRYLSYMIENQEIGFTHSKFGMESDFTLHRIPAGILHAWIH